MPGANPVPEFRSRANPNRMQSYRTPIGAVVAPVDGRTVASTQAFAAGPERAAKLGIALARLGRVATWLRPWTSPRQRRRISPAVLEAQGGPTLRRHEIRGGTARPATC